MKTNNINTAALIIKPLIPTIRKIAENGKIDGFLQAIKEEQKKKLNLNDDESVEIMLTTEEDGKEYVSLVLLSEMSISKVLLTAKLSDMIVQLMSKI